VAHQSSITAGSRSRRSPTPLGQAFIEYGRVAKTQHLLAMIDPVDDTHRRAVNTQTTVQESRHRLAGKICHGKCGQIYQRYREGQENQLGALGIALNAVTPVVGIECLQEPGFDVYAGIGQVVHHVAAGGGQCE